MRYLYYFLNKYKFWKFLHEGSIYFLQTGSLLRNTNLSDIINLVIIFKDIDPFEKR